MRSSLEKSIRRFIHSRVAHCTIHIACIIVAVSALTGRAAAQQQQNSSDLPDINPIRIVEDAADVLPGQDDGDRDLSSSLNIILLLTVLTLAPSILIMTTCFARIIIVLGLLRQALGTQGLPPSQIVVGLSLFLTFVIMAPTAKRMYNEGVQPYANGEIKDYRVAWERTKQPLRDFMFAQIEATGNWSGVYLMLNYRGIDTSEPAELKREDVDMLSLVPAFMLSELKVAFLMGFRIYLPFLVIDVVIASMLISMGMLMLPPVLISLPFKLLLFVLVDGWQLIVGSLMTSFMNPEQSVTYAAAATGALSGAGP